MYIVNPASPSTTSPSLKYSALSTHPQSDCRKGQVVNTGAPAVGSPAAPERARGKLSRNRGTLWSVGLSELVTNSAINFLVINGVASY